MKPGMAACIEPRLKEGQEERYRRCRALTEALAAPLSDADATVQPHPDASPAKWHLAHVTWFFETFVLRDHLPGYRSFDARFAFLFNSYYEAEGPRHSRAARGLLSRPSLEDVLRWRAHVDQALLGGFSGLPSEAHPLIELGIQHEQQHQELLQTDILATLAENPLEPRLWPSRTGSPAGATEQRWVSGRSGIVEVGHVGTGFAFDCEGPRHRVLLHPHALADRPVSNDEWRAFMADGGYLRPELWLADGWSWVRAKRVAAPLYWREREGFWDRFGMDGLRPIVGAAPVTHISYYEADAFARWAGARLPTEAEWESAAAELEPTSGTQLDAAGPVEPLPASPAGGVRQMFGDVWEWTASAFLPYPGFRPAPGAVGEYNGKFMSGQFVLRGGSCATPRGHVRPSYRNFFYPHQRWQFTGLRLARDE